MKALLRRLADLLMQIGAIQFGAFKLKLHETNPDAPLSPIYINLRRLRGSPETMDMVAKVFKEMLEGLDCDLIADIPHSISPVVAVLSHKTRISMVTPRLPKDRGTGATVEGIFRSGQTVVVFDDLITKADSKLEAIRVLEEKGLEVSDVVVLVDREQGGAKELDERGYELHAAVTLTELLKYYVDTEQIDQAKYGEVIAYLAKNS